MNIRLLFLVSMIGMAALLSSAQEFEAQKGAFIIDGRAGFSSKQGDIYSYYYDDKIGSVNLSSEFRFFPTDCFYAGGRLEYSASILNGHVSSAYKVGPVAGLMAILPGNSVFPFVEAGIQYARNYPHYIYLSEYQQVSQGGRNILLATGLLIPLKEHLALSIDVSLNWLSYQILGSGGRVYGFSTEIGVGVSGLFY